MTGANLAKAAAPLCFAAGWTVAGQIAALWMLFAVAVIAVAGCLLAVSGKSKI